MLLRAFFALGLALILFPHEPNLGLRPAAYNNLGPVFVRAQTEIRTRLDAVVLDMRSGNIAPRNLNAAED